MLNLEDLSQFAAFYKLGTLTKVAEEYHISQPTITRTMKRVEEAFGVSLFHRTGNHIAFNETGKKAVEYAEELLKAAEECESKVREFEKKLRSLSIISCAPAPLWSLIPILSRKNPGKTISSDMSSDVVQIEKDFLAGKYDIAILPYPLEKEGTSSEFYLEEHLYINVPLDHALASCREVTAAMINGYNCLLGPEIGFWESFCTNSLPDSRFLVQKDDFSFQELIHQSSLPFFTTNLSDGAFSNIENRINIPITDADANVSFYVITHVMDTSI